MENHLDMLQKIVQEKGTKIVVGGLQTIQQNYMHDLSIVLATIKQVRPDITIDKDMYEQVIQIIEQMEASTDQYIQNMFAEQEKSREAIVAALTKTSPLSINPTVTGTPASTPGKAIVKKLPGDYIRANKKEFLTYVASLLRDIYKVENLNSLHPTSGKFDNKDICIDYTTFAYTKDAKNLLSNIGYVLGFGNMNFRATLAAIEEASPSGAEVVVQVNSSNTTQPLVQAKSDSADNKPKISRQFNIFTDILLDKDKKPVLKKTFLDAIQKKMSSEKPEAYDLTTMEDAALETIVDITFEDINFQWSIKSILTWLTKALYGGTNIDKATHYLMDKAWIAKPRWRHPGSKSESESTIETIKNEDTEQAKTARILDIVMDPKYGFPVDFPSRLSEIVWANPNRFDDYIQHGVTSIKSTLGWLSNKNILDYTQTKIRIWINWIQQDTTVANFLESIAYIKYNTHDISHVALELFPMNAGNPTATIAQPTKKQEPVIKPIEKPTPDPIPVVKKEFTWVSFSSPTKFQETMLPIYRDMLIDVKRERNDKSKRPEYYTNIVNMLDAIKQSVEHEHEKGNIPEWNYKAALRIVRGYSQMSENTISSKFATEWDACFMIKEIHAILNTKDRNKL